jgi:hypothetical protein
MTTALDVYRQLGEMPSIAFPYSVCVMRMVLDTAVCSPLLA